MRLFCYCQGMADHTNKTVISPKSTDTNESVDFFSDKFDPLAALYSENLKIPHPDVPGYDNLAIYESKETPDPQKMTNKKKKSDVSQENKIMPTQRRFLPHQMPVTRERPVKKIKNLFTKMENIQGPLAALRKYKDERIKIKIVNRNDKGIRGFYLAYLVAFDKHWNLALEEVTEVWTRRKHTKTPVMHSSTSTNKWLRKNRIKPPEVTVVNSDKKTDTCSRYVEQLLVRGEHIVIIYPYINE